MRNRNFQRGNFSEYSDEHKQKFFKDYQERRQRFRMLFGVGIAICGIGLMLRTLGILPYFSLDLSWPYILIIIGLLIGAKSGFRHNIWWLLIVVGIANIIPQFTIMGHPSRDLFWPALAICAGLSIAFRPSRKNCFPGKRMDSSISNESNMNIDITFGGKKEIVTSKDFKGGVVSVTFAGCEINLTQADFTEPEVVLDFRVSFGGVELIVPANWEVQNEISPSFGSVEDERTIHTATVAEAKKTLILRGSCAFGSIEIKSY
jgi:predicted membrane protein